MNSTLNWQTQHGQGCGFHIRIHNDLTVVSACFIWGPFRWKRARSTGYQTKGRWTTPRSLMEWRQWKVQVNQNYYIDSSVLHKEYATRSHCVPGTWQCTSGTSALNIRRTSSVHGSTEKCREIAYARFSGFKCPMVIVLSVDSASLLSNCFRSPPINIEDIGPISLRIRRPGSNDHNFVLVQVDIRIESSTIFVIISPADNGWPFEIENFSDYILSVSQTVMNLPLHP